MQMTQSATSRTKKYAHGKLFLADLLHGNFQITAQSPIDRLLFPKEHLKTPLVLPFFSDPKFGAPTKMESASKLSE